MNKTKVLTTLLMLVLIPAVAFADFRDHIDRLEFGPSAGVGFYVGQKAPAATTHPDLLRVQSYDAIAFGERGTLKWPGIETFGFSVGYRIDTRWHVTLKAVRQRVCFAEYDSIISTSNVPEEVRSVYYNSMWHVDAMAEFNLLNYGNIMAPEQAIYNVVPYVGMGVGVTIFNKNATLRAINRNNNSFLYSKMNTCFPQVGKMYKGTTDGEKLKDKNELAVGLYIPVAFGVKWRINNNVQLKGSFQYQLYFSNKGKGGLNSNLEGATAAPYLTAREGSVDVPRCENVKNRPAFDQLDKHIVGYNHDCLFSISAIFNLDKWKEDRLIMY